MSPPTSRQEPPYVLVDSAQTWAREEKSVDDIPSVRRKVMIAYPSGFGD